MSDPRAERPLDGTRGWPKPFPGRLPIGRDTRAAMPFLRFRYEEGVWVWPGRYAYCTSFQFCLRSCYCDCSKNATESKDRCAPDRVGRHASEDAASESSKQLVVNLDIVIYGTAWDETQLTSCPSLFYRLSTKAGTCIWWRIAMERRAFARLRSSHIAIGALHRVGPLSPTSSSTPPPLLLVILAG